MSEWIDVTRPLAAGMIQWPGDPPFQLRRIQCLAGPGTVNLGEIQTCLHVGTHIDAPLHCLPDGGDIADVPLEALCGPAVVVDVTTPGPIAPADMGPARVSVGDRILLRTLNRHLWREPGFRPDYQPLSAEAAEWLARAGVRLVGIDYLSPDASADADLPVHQILLSAGVVLIEGLDLDPIRPGWYEMVALPLKIAGAEASPVRVILRPGGLVRHIRQPFGLTSSRPS